MFLYNDTVTIYQITWSFNQKMRSLFRFYISIAQKSSIIYELTNREILFLFSDLCSVCPKGTPQMERYSISPWRKDGFYEEKNLKHGVDSLYAVGNDSVPRGGKNHRHHNSPQGDCKYVINTFRITAGDDVA